MIKNVGPGLTVGTEKIAHVFDEAQNRHLHRAQHFQAAQRVLERHILGRGDDDSAC